MKQDLTNRLLADAPYLSTLQRRSAATCEDLAEKLVSIDVAGRGVDSICVVGSLGRLEVNDSSDVDGIVVLKKPLAKGQRENLMADIEACYAAAGLRVAKATGIYRQPITVAEILDEAQRGSLTETPSAYGKRIQILLDARPLFGRDAFINLQEKLCAWFSPDLGVSKDGSQFLLTEIKRYFNAYSAWQKFKFDKSSDDGWLLRQAKLKITRTTTIAALVLVLGACSDVSQNMRVQDYLPATPLQRILLVFSKYQDQESFENFLLAYESAVKQLSDSRMRALLVALSPTSYSEISIEHPPQVSSLFNLAEQLGQILSDFILARRGEWSASFYRSCLF